MVKNSPREHKYFNPTIKGKQSLEDSTSEILILSLKQKIRQKIPNFGLRGTKFTQKWELDWNEKTKILELIMNWKRRTQLLEPFNVSWGITWIENQNLVVMNKSWVQLELCGLKSKIWNTSPTGAGCRLKFQIWNTSPTGAGCRLKSKIWNTSPTGAGCRLKSKIWNTSPTGAGCRLKSKIWNTSPTGLKS